MASRGWSVWVLVAASVVAGCSSSDGVSEPASPSSPQSVPSDAGSGGPLDGIPEESRVSDGGGEPRSTTYWITWSTCGEGSQAGVAEANGGREAGWIVLDDLIETPGLSLGVHTVTDCPDAVAILGSAVVIPRPSGRVDALAAQLLAAQANRSSGSEGCPAADAALAVGGALLTEVRFSGAGSADRPDAEIADAIDETLPVLVAYNAGELCV
jgi:hypothetical protein